MLTDFSFTAKNFLLVKVFKKKRQSQSMLGTMENWEELFKIVINHDKENDDKCSNHVGGNSITSSAIIIKYKGYE